MIDFATSTEDKHAELRANREREENTESEWRGNPKNQKSCRRPPKQKRFDMVHWTSRKDREPRMRGNRHSDNEEEVEVEDRATDGRYAGDQWQFADAHTRDIILMTNAG